MNRRLRDYLDGETLFLMILVISVLVSGIAAMMESAQKRKDSTHFDCPFCGRRVVK